LLGADSGVGAAGVLGGIALVLTAVGGIVGSVLAARRPHAAPDPAPPPGAVWFETLHQLEAASAERDDLRAENETLRAQLASANVMVDFYRRQAEGEGEA
jgi:hypothetical protein